jgi:hypothetical protein
VATSGPAEFLSNPVVAFALRAIFGAYVIYMARGFYADPMNYFRKWMPRMPQDPWRKRLIRGAACFCIWGGCFIIVTAVATQIFGLHGWPLAFALVLLAALATPLLLPANVVPILDDSGNGGMRQSK